MTTLFLVAEVTEVTLSGRLRLSPTWAQTPASPWPQITSLLSRLAVRKYWLSQVQAQDQMILVITELFFSLLAIISALTLRVSPSLSRVTLCRVQVLSLETVTSLEESGAQDICVTVRLCPGREAT